MAAVYLVGQILDLVDVNPAERSLTAFRWDNIIKIARTDDGYALRTDLGQLASAPAAERTGDVQKIAATALAGGYGDGIQQLAQQAEQALASGH